MSWRSMCRSRPSRSGATFGMGSSLRPGYEARLWSRAATPLRGSRLEGRADKMPRMPKGMFHRAGRGYYARKWVAGRDRWIALGADFRTAGKKLREINRTGLGVGSRATVAQAA